MPGSKTSTTKRIAIVGSGVVGEASGRGFAEHGHTVTFCDIDEEKLAKFRGEGLTAIRPEELDAHPIDIFFISIQTPTNDEGVDLGPLKKALASVGDAIRNAENSPVVAIRSTVPVGTAREVAAPILEERSGKKAGVDFGVASNPEYLREKSAYDDFLNPRAVTVGSEDERTNAVLVELYESFNAPIYSVTTREAEMQKYTHNLYNAAKISFFNEQRMVCDASGIDADTIFPIVVASAEASWNPRYGTKNLGPYSGTCLPKDIRGFIERTKEKLDMDLPLLEAVEAVNERVKRAFK